MKNRHSQTKKVPILIDFAYFFNLKTKANQSPKGNGFVFTLFGDPYETRTRVTAVKGRCLNRLTKGPYFRHDADYEVFIPKIW